MRRMEDVYKRQLDHLQKDGVFLLNKVNENPMVTLALYYVMPRSLMAVAF